MRHELSWLMMLSFGSLVEALVVDLRFCLRKNAIKLGLTINRTTRSFFITQEGIPGFVLKVHDNVMSWLYE